MALEYGSAASSRITTSAFTVTIGAASRAALTMGWWRPTTLTAARYLWGAGVYGFQIAPTTTRIRHVQDRTTDTLTDTNEDILVLNEWVFLAFLCSHNNTTSNTQQELFYGYSPAYSLGGGTLTRATWSVNTAGSGSLTGSTLVIGNNSGAASAFQGQIGPIFMLASSCPVSAVAHPLHLSTFGSWTAGEREWVLANMIEPFYRFGTIPVLENGATNGLGAAGTASNITQWGVIPPVLNSYMVLKSNAAASALPLAYTASNLTNSELRAPQPGWYERGMGGLLGGQHKIKNGHRR